MTLPATDTRDRADAWIPDDSTLGARLALVRQRMKWNIAEAARECGVTTESWRLWEQSGRSPRSLVTIAMAISTRTGVDPDWLIRGRLPNARYVVLDDLWSSPPHPALEPRVLVRHGDARRKAGRPVDARPTGQRRPVALSEDRGRPISHPAVA